MVMIMSACLMIMIACGNKSGTETNSNSRVDSSVLVVQELHVAPVLGIVIDLNGKILHIETNSAAEAAGLQRGDIVQSITGLNVRADRFREIASKVHNTPAGNLINVIVERNNAVTELKVSPKSPVGTSNQPTPTAVPQDEYYL